MALDALLEALARDADHAVEKLLATAREEAARVRATAEADVSRQRDEAIARREVELRASAELTRSRAQRRAAVAILQARSRCLERIFYAANEALAHALDDPAQGTALGALTAEALAFLPAAPVVARCHGSLADRVRAAAEPLGVRTLVVDDALSPGVVLEAEDGSIVVDNTLEARLRRLRPALSIELLRHIGDAP